MNHSRVSRSQPTLLVFSQAIGNDQPSDSTSYNDIVVCFRRPGFNLDWGVIGESSGHAQKLNRNSETHGRMHLQKPQDALNNKKMNDRGRECDCSHFRLGRRGHYKHVVATRSNDLLSTRGSVLAWEAKAPRVRHGLCVLAAEHEATPARMRTLRDCMV